MKSVIRTLNIHERWVFWKVFCKMCFQTTKLSSSNRKIVLNGLKASLFKNDKK